MTNIFTYMRDMKVLKQQLVDNSRLVELRCGATEYAAVGAGSPVLISHGGGGGHNMGLWMAEMYGGPYEYICPSRFGYLRTPLPADPSPAAQADSYALLLDYLGIGRAAVIALSAGGMSALQFAVRYPDRCRGLVMISAVSREMGKPFPPSLRMGVTAGLVSDFLIWAISNSIFIKKFNGMGMSATTLARIRQDPEVSAQIDQMTQSAIPASLRKLGTLKDFDYMFNNLPEVRGTEICVPLMIIHAINDPFIPYETAQRLAEIVPGARLLALPDGGHFACASHYKVYRPQLLEFLSHLDALTAQV